jgi:D-alanyl-D-alanine carboxypeptidase
MNSAASSSGLIHTSFADVTGLDAGNVSTAREVLLMSLDTFKDPLVRLLTSSAKYPVSIADGISPPHPIGNTNMLVYDPAVKVIAGKTGFTYEAGYTLTTRLAKKGKKDLIVVVLGSRTKARSFSEGKALANWAWKYNLK